jgi:hypothetical protein
VTVKGGDHDRRILFHTTSRTSLIPPPRAQERARRADVHCDFSDAGLSDGPAVVVHVDELALAVHARFERAEPARILRVFRGAVRADELDAYVAEAQAGMTADAEVNDGLITLIVGDDGTGFDIPQFGATEPGHFGLLGMKERATKIHARLTLESRRGAGTRIAAAVPCQAPQDLLPQ